MFGDKIHMDYFSVLGPIDPQIDDMSEKRDFRTGIFNSI